MKDVQLLINKYVKNLTLKSYFSLVLMFFALVLFLPFAKIKYDFNNRKSKKYGKKNK